MAASQFTELSDFVRAYEAVHEGGGWAPLEEFLPGPSHPLYPTVLRELVCIDLEYGWKRRQPRRLEAYRVVFPELFQQPESLQEIAYLEYCLRLEAGEQPTRLEYQRTFGIETAGWPEQPAHAFAEPAGSAGRPAAEGDGLLEPATSYQRVRVQNPDGLDSWLSSFQGSPEHAGLFL
jgi:hypothetical protein